MTTPGTNVCGILVHAMPERFDSVLAALGAIAGVEVHHTAEGGRIVVTAEDTPESLALDQLSAIHRIPGVVAAALVYHHFEPAASTSAAE